MYVGAVGGLLTALVSPALGPFTFFFAFLFGVFVDVFLFIFKIKGSTQGVNRNRLMAAMAVSTLLIAVSSYSAFAIFPQYIQGFTCQFVCSKKPHARCAGVVYGSSDGCGGGLCSFVLVE